MKSVNRMQKMVLTDVLEIRNEEGTEQESAPHPSMVLYVEAI